MKQDPGNAARGSEVPQGSGPDRWTRAVLADGSRIVDRTMQVHVAKLTTEEARAALEARLSLSRSVDVESGRTGREMTSERAMKATKSELWNTADISFTEGGCLLILNSLLAEEIRRQIALNGGQFCMIDGDTSQTNPNMVC